MHQQAIRATLLTFVAPRFVFLVGCDGSSSPRISVSIANKPTSVTAGGSLTLNASVANDKTNSGVSWGISPSSGSGTLSHATATSVLYTVPPSPPGPSAPARFRGICLLFKVERSHRIRPASWAWFRLPPRRELMAISTTIRTFTAPHRSIVSSAIPTRFLST